MLKFESSFQRIRLFKSDQLEKLTLISPKTFATTWIIILPLIAWSGWSAASPVEGLMLALFGLATWALFEYMMHRYLFHWNADNRFIRWCVYLMHGNHHQYPNDPLRNLMPLSVSLPISAAIWTVAYALIGFSGSWFVLGFLIGYVFYDVIHYACHQWPMRSATARLIKRHHMRHHYVDKEMNFSISTIFVDRLFGTTIQSVKPKD